MKTKHILLLSFAIVAGFVNACATTSVPATLELARISEARVRSGPPAKLAPVELSAAEHVLGRANQEYARNGDTNACRDLAYIAENKLELAEAVAQTELDRAQSKLLIVDELGYRPFEKGIAMGEDGVGVLTSLVAAGASTGNRPSGRPPAPAGPPSRW